MLKNYWSNNEQFADIFNAVLFDGEEVIRIEKGIRLFDTGKSMTICEQAEKRCKEHIYSREKDRYHAEIFLYGWRVEVLNIRAEQRESRDLMQDLQDIRDGTGYRVHTKQVGCN